MLQLSLKQIKPRVLRFRTRLHEKRGSNCKNPQASTPVSCDFNQLKFHIQASIVVSIRFFREAYLSRSHH